MISKEFFDEDGRRTLDHREFRFVEAYVAGDYKTKGNAFRSALIAGYSHSTSVAHSAGWVRPEHLGGTKLWVHEAIQLRRKEIEERAKVTSEEVIEETRKLALFNTMAFVKSTSDGDPYIDTSEMTAEDWAAIGEVQIEEYLEGRGEDARTVKRIKLKPYDKRAALSDLSKILGLQKIVHSNDPKNPMPGVVVNGMQQYDLTKLSVDELAQLRALLVKATPDPVTPQRPGAAD